MFFIFLASVFLFLGFRNIKITGKAINRIIRFFSSATVYVYLAHEAPSIRDYLWSKVVNPLGHPGFPDLVINLVVGVGAVYIAGTVIGKAVTGVYRLLRIDRLTLLISNRLDITQKMALSEATEKQTDIE